MVKEGHTDTDIVDLVKEAEIMKVNNVQSLFKFVESHPPLETDVPVFFSRDIFIFKKSHRFSSSQSSISAASLSRFSQTK
jgi:hypothetical protein